MVLMSRIALSVILTFGFSIAQRGDITQPRMISESNFCSAYLTCSECLQQDQCAWCSKQDFVLKNKPLARCNPRHWLDPSNEIMETSCSGNIINSTVPMTVTITNDDVLGSEGKGHQIKPQQISIRTGLHQPINLRLQFSRVPLFPLDLYYIIDVSSSMKNHKEKLANLSASLAKAMMKVTNNLRMGFGSFIDKPILPFTNESEPGRPRDDRAYLFKHHLTLTHQDTATNFASEVRKAQTYDSLDFAEGGLEALVQAIVCTKHIGWRNNSQKLIIFSTDALYHIAGDGKLAGITEPNDGQCHLNEDSDHRFHYDQFRFQDYPSVSQISRIVAQNSMNVVFAVAPPVAKYYRDLSKQILGATVGELTEDIVAVIEEQYNKISSSVELVHRSSDAVRISYSSSCLSGSRPVNTSRCDKVKPGSVVNFDVTITVEKCLNRRNFKERINIFPVGINEALTIDLDVVCECPCEVASSLSSVGNDKQCNSVGTYQCGDCECNSGYSGPKCECDERKRILENNCKLAGDGQAPDCNGRGECVCGVCQCTASLPANRRVWGSHCECDDFACPLSPINGLVCSGSDQGLCPCNNNGTCKCQHGWRGESCECPTGDELCNLGGEICSGKGKCSCGKCDCETTKYGPYTGNYCENSPMLCKELKDCVRCKAFGTGPMAINKCLNCELNVTIVPPEEVQEIEEGDRLCSELDESNCNFFFIYNNRRTREIIVSKECVDPPNVVAIATGVVGAILAIGLFGLVVWKILTTIHDRLEYAKFLRERALARWDRGENPLYRRPTTIFLNPAYNKED